MNPDHAFWFPILFLVAAVAFRVGIEVLSQWDGRWESSSHTSRIAGLAQELGLAPKGDLECAGTTAGRPVRVVQNVDGSYSIEVGVGHPPKFRIHRGGLVGTFENMLGAAVPSGDGNFDQRFVVTSRGDRGRASAALDERLRAHVKRLFDGHDVSELDTFGTADALYADRHLFGGGAVLHVRTSSRPAPRLLEELHSVALLLEGVPLHVVKLGAERRAERSSSGAARCSYCHGDITGSEPDLVACDKCATILHEGCWAEAGGCPTLGCGSKTPERARA